MGGLKKNRNEKAAVNALKIEDRSGTFSFFSTEPVPVPVSTHRQTWLHLFDSPSQKNRLLAFYSGSHQPFRKKERIVHLWRSEHV